MYRRYYDGYNTYDNAVAGKGEVIMPRSTSDNACENDVKDVQDMQDMQDEDNIEVARHSKGLGGILGDIEIDDIILIGVLLLLLQDSVDDTMLIVIIGIIFLGGILDT